MLTTMSWGQMDWPRLAGYVLLAEDNPDNQDPIGYMLKQMRVRHRVVSKAVARGAARTERRSL